MLFQCFKPVQFTVNSSHKHFVSLTRISGIQCATLLYFSVCRLFSMWQWMFKLTEPVFCHRHTDAGKECGSCWSLQECWDAHCNAATHRRQTWKARRWVCEKRRDEAKAFMCSSDKLWSYKAISIKHPAFLFQVMPQWPSHTVTLPKNSSVSTRRSQTLSLLLQVQISIC